MQQISNDSATTKRDSLNVDIVLHRDSIYQKQIQELKDTLSLLGANVNAAATIDKEGFGGHTPLFNVIVSDAYVNGRQRDAYMAQRLLDLGADIHIRVSISIGAKNQAGI